MAASLSAMDMPQSKCNENRYFMSTEGIGSGKSAQGSIRFVRLAGQEFSRRNQLADIRSKKVASPVTGEHRCLSAIFFEIQRVAGDVPGAEFRVQEKDYRQSHPR